MQPIKEKTAAKPQQKTIHKYVGKQKQKRKY